MKIKEYVNMIICKRYVEESIKTINIYQAEILLKRDKTVKLVDVRSPQEYAEGHREKAILIPNYEMKEKAERILKNKNDYIIIYCATRR